MKSILRSLAASAVLLAYMLLVAAAVPPRRIPTLPTTPEERFQLFFSLNDDMALGAQTAKEIESNPKEYPILDPQQYPQSYAYIQRIVTNLIGSNQVRYGYKFQWRVRIINKDVLNAFCAPGGYIYVYTGLIHFLDAEYELAGVMGHEMAHADRRHTSRQLEKTYGLALISQLALGDRSSGQLAQIAQGLVGLSFSRAHEREADEWSVRYLCPTGYPAFGAARFFEKLQEKSKGQSQPQFLSTHPDPGNRVQAIRALSQKLGCKGQQQFDVEYAAFKKQLPPLPPAPAR